MSRLASSLPPGAGTRAAMPFHGIGRVIRESPRRVAFVLLALAVASCFVPSASGAETTWRITKENGAYRINGCRLAANGKLSDPNTATERTLTRKELDEIGRAIDAYEASPHADNRYAAPAVAGKTQTTPTADPQPYGERDTSGASSANSSGSNSSPSSPPTGHFETADEQTNSVLRDNHDLRDAFFGAVVVITILVVVAQLFKKKTRCPKCGNVEIKVLSHETGEGGLRVKTDYGQGNSRQRLVNVTHHRFRCYCPKCRHQWDHYGSDENDN